MPTLPSGLEVAVDPAPLRKLLLDFASPFNAHHLMALQCTDDLFRWLDVLILKPADALTADECANSQPAPDGAPTSFRAIPAGARLSDWRSVAPAWSDDDRAAFADFIDARIRPAMVRALANVRERQETLLKTPTVAGAFACMWRDGIHPLQDDGDD
jgi:hypothetical protein